jgi:hypothetical protein
MYTNVQLIAYEVPTAPALPAGDCSLDDNKLIEEVKGDKMFTSSLGSLGKDANARVCRMLAVMDLAFRSNAPRTNSDTLKIFMAPEFYFRPTGNEKSRSYAASDMVAAQQLFRTVFSQAKLAHWVFVAGSIVWNMKGKVALSSGLSGGVSEEYFRALEELADNDTVYNTVIVGIGAKGVQLYDKVNYSIADQIDQKWRPLKDYCLQSPSQNLLKAGELLIGLEVCYDHECGQLKTNYDAFKATYGDDPPDLDLQLLTACGMQIQPRKVVAGAKRLVLRVDGTDGAFGDGRFDHSEIQAVVASGRNGATQMVDPISNPNGWKALNAPLQEADLQGDYAMKLDGFEEAVWSKPKGTLGAEIVTQKLGTSFKQKLKVYPHIPLAHLQQN